MPKEPQSYGSHGDWISGDAGEELNRQKDAPNCGKVSDIQASEIPEQPVQKVSAHKSGAKRGSFFRDRDYRR